MNTELLTPAEEELLTHLARAWEMYLELPKLHPMHEQEFLFFIHGAQRLIMSRPVSRPASPTTAHGIGVNGEIVHFGKD